jgi:hypothetical protein
MTAYRCRHDHHPRVQGGEAPGEGPATGNDPGHPRTRSAWLAQHARAASAAASCSPRPACTSC